MVPDRADAALILLDVINDLEWDGGEQLLPHFLDMAPRLAELKRRGRQAGIPAIYVNDNYGRWQSDFQRLVEHCTSAEVRGHEAVRLLVPDEHDYFVLKPKHSGFYSTTLEILLKHLQAHTLIVTGVAGNICVLFTANDAYMRDYRVVVPSDCVASNDPEDNRQALRAIEEVLKGDTTPSVRLDLQALCRQPAEGSR
jgi:nicotinamidase-related amidase